MLINKWRIMVPGLLAASAVTAGAAVFSGPSWAEDKPAAAANDPNSSDRLTVAEFEQLHQKLTKMGTEKVWSIPWQVSVREARVLAAKENKPLLLWCTNNGGTNPLGPC